MLTALILICSLEATSDLQSCTRDTAVDTMRVPELFANPAMCFTAKPTWPIPRWAAT